MEKQKARARNATANEFGDWHIYAEGSEKFIGYDSLTAAGVKILKQRTVKQKNKTMFQIVFDRTPFYGEMGGEVGDTGVAVSASGERIKILDTIKENDLTIHIADKIPSDCESTFMLVVDEERRHKIEANHSVTHLLDNALREVLGNHVEQKGSFVGPDYLRFDFSHFSKMTPEQIVAVEKKVNELIRTDYPLEEKRDATMEEAKAAGAIALFSEKYGDKVRVVKFGPSVELCGGCHIASTGRIGLFKIVSESAVAAGVRRIEALTGAAAENYIYAAEDTIRSVRAFFNNAPDITAAIQRLISENDEYKKQVDEFSKQKVAQLAEKLSGKAEDVNGHKLIRLSLSVSDSSIYRDVAIRLQKSMENTILAAALNMDGKPQLLLMYTDDLIAAGKNAGKDVREAAKLIQGGGGGQPGLASAGGRNADGLDAALTKLVEIATA